MQEDAGEVVTSSCSSWKLRDFWQRACNHVDGDVDQNKRRFSDLAEPGGGKTSGLFSGNKENPAMVNLGDGGTIRY